MDRCIWRWPIRCIAKRKYHDAIDELEIAQKLSPNNAGHFGVLCPRLLAVGRSGPDSEVCTTRRAAGCAKSAHGEHCRQQRPESREQRSHALIAGERSSASGIYLSTGAALSQLGDQNAALDRFGRALTTPGSDRVSIRLAIAQDHGEAGSCRGCEAADRPGR